MGSRIPPAIRRTRKLLFCLYRPPADREIPLLFFPPPFCAAAKSSHDRYARAIRAAAAAGCPVSYRGMYMRFCRQTILHRPNHISVMGRSPTYLALAVFSAVLQAVSFMEPFFRICRQAGSPYITFYKNQACRRSRLSQSCRTSGPRRGHRPSGPPHSRPRRRSRRSSPSPRCRPSPAARRRKSR